MAAVALRVLLGLLVLLGVATGDGSGTDGWRPAAPPLESGCGIARRSSKSMGPGRFAREFKGRLPVILEGHKSVKRARNAFSPAALLELAGDAAVQVGDAAEIVRAHGQGPNTKTLREFIALMRQPGDSSEETPYLFDRGAFFAQSAAAALLPKLPFPPGLIHQRTRDEEPPSLMGFILDGNDESGEPVPSADNYLLLGGNGSSVGFHAHADSVVALLYGVKRWFLFPPDAAPRPRWRDPRGMVTWAERRASGEGDAAAAGSESGSELIECVQRTGELLYVPEGWYHATLNYGETLAVAQQARIGSSEWYRLRLLGTQLANAKAFAEASEVMEATLEKYPERAEAHAALATLLLDMLEPAPGSGVPPYGDGDPQLTEALWQRTEQLLVGAVQRDPTDDGSHINLCKILTRRANAASEPSQQQMRAAVLDAARVHCDQAVALNAEDFQSRFYAGGQRSAAADFDEAVTHYAAAVVLEMTSAEAHFQLSQALLKKAFSPGAAASAGVVTGAVIELSQAAELLCERCVAGAGASASAECECLSSDPRGRALSLFLAAGDGGDGLLEREDVLAAVESELKAAEAAAQREL